MPTTHRSARFAAHALALALAGLLSACGGGLNSAAPDAGPQAAPVSLNVEVAEEGTPVSAAIASIEARPSFHAAPVLLDEPLPDSAAPAQTWLTAAQAAQPTRQRSADSLRDAPRVRALAGSDSLAQPMATSTPVVTYTPAQIRAAYRLPTIAAATKAQLGAGQTIYIVNAKHDPNIVAELAAFNAKFGLPACTSRTLAATTALPLAAAGSSCELVIAYSTSSAGLSNTAPAYDSGWATEIALDVQWAHAIAPLARLVLIEAPDAMVSNLSAAVRLASRMGPGVVSMSFGAPEGSWVTSLESSFASSGMSYLAATGDDGAGVFWPAVSARVVAVSGTSLSWSGTGSRTETTWSGTGGGVSSYVALPAYQNGTARTAKRAVADVAFNANPYTGQYVATMTPGSTAVRWISAGGTSLATPQWAGLLAVANALRAQGGKSALGLPHSALYGTVAKTSGTLLDITTGSNGSCASCAAVAGYDTPTGLGTPHGSSVLTALSGASVSAGSSPAASSLRVSSTLLSGKANAALAATIGLDLAGASSAQINISGAPQGMSFSASAAGIAVSWAKPVAGSYTLQVNLTDNLGRSAQAAVPVSISK
jgi:subtilase family serine protease